MSAVISPEPKTARFQEKREAILNAAAIKFNEMGVHGATLADIDFVAYTRGPGLAGALLVGAGVACAMAAALEKPAIGVHHLEGHLLAPLLEDDPPPFPHVALLVSGGHTMLIEVQGIGRYELLGETRDDAAGEASLLLVTTGRRLAVALPGGRLALLATGRRDRESERFWRARPPNPD